MYAYTSFFVSNVVYMNIKILWQLIEACLFQASGEEFLRSGAYHRLTTRDPQQFWTSGQWMTEKKGGSDVGKYVGS